MMRSLGPSEWIFIHTKVHNLTSLAADAFGAGVMRFKSVDGGTIVVRSCDSKKLKIDGTDIEFDSAIDATRFVLLYAAIKINSQRDTAVSK